MTNSPGSPPVCRKTVRCSGFMRPPRPGDLCAGKMLRSRTSRSRPPDQATETFARADVAGAPGWARFFNATDLSAMVGTVGTELALRVDPTYTRQAIPALTTALVGYGPDMARSRSFNLSALATNHLLDGDIDQAVVIGTKAVEASEGLKSARTKDRMRPLQHQATQRAAHPEARELSERITAFFNTRIGCSWAQPTHDCTSPCRHAWCPPPATIAA
jgi:hypothetical protein